MFLNEKPNEERNKKGDNVSRETLSPFRKKL